MVTRGECARSAAKKEILVFAYDGKKRRQHEFVKEFEKRKQFSKNTVTKYLKALVIDDKMIKMEAGPREIGFKALYSINQKGIEEVKRNTTMNLLASLNVLWLEPLKNLIIKMKTEDPNKMLERFCFTFIGDVPCAFSKSLDSFQHHMSIEQSLGERHHKELYQFHDEYVKTWDSKARLLLDAKIREEVGWTTGEYLKILIKRTEKEDGFTQMCAILGITEEMLKDM